MLNIQDVLAKLQERATKMSLETSSEIGKPGAVDCKVCNDKEVVYGHVDEKGYEIYKPCDCRTRKAWRRPFKNALIPDGFTQSTMESYVQTSPIQEAMFQLIEEYLRRFPKSKKILDKLGMNNFGFIATIGEQRIRSLPEANRAEIKTAHNNYGIGKLIYRLR